MLKFLFYVQLSSTYAKREKVIKGCITLSANRIKLLASEKDKDPNNPSVVQDLRREQNKVIPICFCISLG